MVEKASISRFPKTWKSSRAKTTTSHQPIQGEVKIMFKWLIEKIFKRTRPEVGGLWKVKATVEKYHEDIKPFRGREYWFYQAFKPYEVVDVSGNGLLNEGINNMWTLICGGSATAYDNTYARLGVGDSDTAHAASQTELQAVTNKVYGDMEDGYPEYGTSQKAVFKASFDTDTANFTWNEWSIDNGSSASLNMNRKVESLGTKASGTWTLTVEITLS
jgi:hypothetical protein